LFVPGGRADFLAKADTRGADAVLIDLEDSVAEGGLDAARKLVGEWIQGRPWPTDPVVCVRINAIDEGMLHDDLDAVVHPALTAVLVPKVMHEDDMAVVADALSYHEGRRCLPHGQVRIWPLMETASAIQRAGEIARSTPRIAYMGGATSVQGDIVRALNFKWTPQGDETLFLRSKILVDVRAAGVPNPITGLVSGLGGSDAVVEFARQSRSLGYDGMMVIHPDHVAIANEAFSPTDAERAEAREMAAAFAEGETRGLGAVTHKGRMIDRANVETLRAQGLLD
jgi:citrate lyase subunit beta/citryl-CoA lyase